MNRYVGFMSDSRRWERFEARADDVVISTPAKCGTTWTQQLVGMLVLGRTELGMPIATLSPWLDVTILGDDEILGTLDAQEHRRFVKTHTPLDGVPWWPTVTYLTVFRHPLDVALSYRDHRLDMNVEQVLSMRTRVAGTPPPTGDPYPEEPDAFLRNWVERDGESQGTGATCLADFANSLNVSWARRERPNVHLFHYTDLWNDLGGQIRRIAQALDIEIDDDACARYVEAGTLDAMRERVSETVPFADTDHFHDPANFFAAGGGRAWRQLLSADEIAAAEAHCIEMVGADAAGWVWRTPATG